MPKRAIEINVLTIQLDHHSKQPMYRQLYEGLRQAILGGRFKPGARMPATRNFADELGVSRNTVMQAFDQLFAEGYLEGKVGSGTYVSSALPDDLLRAKSIPKNHNQKATTNTHRQLSKRGQQTATRRLTVSDDTSFKVRPFVTGVPALDEFPMDEWMRATNRCWKYLSTSELGYANPEGYTPLRRAIAHRLRDTRAVQCETEQVIICGGTQQAVNLCAQILLDAGDSVWVEDPGYMGAKAALENSGAKLIPVPVDDEGLRVSEGIARAPNARMAFVSPSYQVPMCVTLSLSRRLQLLNHAARTGMWVIEDDYDSEFRYAGRPLASLQSLDTAQRVIYIGTFSKSLLPALRLGFIIVPPDLVDAFTAARAIADRHAHTLEQAVVAEFIAEGHFDAHLRRMRTLYQERQHTLVQAAARELGGLLEVLPQDAGLNLVGWLPPGVDDDAVSKAIRAIGLNAPSISAYALEKTHRRGLLLGYAAIHPKAIRQGVRDMAAVIRNF